MEAQVSSRSLTMADLLAISGYTRDQMRGLLDAMPAYADRNTQVRVAKRYTAQDLLVVRACTQLETRYGLQRSTVASFSSAVRAVLSGPRPVSATACLLLTFEPVDVRYVEVTERITEGLLVPLEPIFQAVDEYLLPGLAKLDWGQRELSFVPRVIGSAKPAHNAALATAPDSAKIDDLQRTRRAP